MELIRRSSEMESVNLGVSELGLQLPETARKNGSKGGVGAGEHSRPEPAPLQVTFAKVDCSGIRTATLTNISIFLATFPYFWRPTVDHLRLAWIVLV